MGGGGSQNQELFSSEPVWVVRRKIGVCAIVAGFWPELHQLSEQKVFLRTTRRHVQIKTRRGKKRTARAESCLITLKRLGLTLTRL